MGRRKSQTTPCKRIIPLVVRRARGKLRVALENGVLVRPDRCEICGEADIPCKDGRSSIQAHHHNGYEGAAALDIQWLCITCHRKETPIAWGERSGSAKLTWEVVDSIRARYAAGESYYKIAPDVGLHPTNVHKVVTQRTWPEHTRSLGLATLGEDT